MKYTFYAAIILIAGLLFSCGQQEENKAENSSTPAAGIHKVVVLQVEQANNYTYLKVKENDSEYWLATGKSSFDKGETLYYDTAMEMKDFASKDLNRTFPVLLLVQNISADPKVVSKPEIPDDPQAGQRTVSQKEDIEINPLKGAVSIADIYKDKDKYNGQTIVVHGKVTKFNANIMGRNWLHIQDGTTDGQNHDLTITTNDMAKVGEVVTFSGKIAVDKDFGAGYKYKLIMEEATLKKQS